MAWRFFLSLNSSSSLSVPCRRRSAAGLRSRARPQAGLERRARNKHRGKRRELPHQANNRLHSPKFVTGESYGGFRVRRSRGSCSATRELASPASCRSRRSWSTTGYVSSSPLGLVARLPSYAAVARQAKGPISRADLADVEQYAQGDFLADVLKGSPIRRRSPGSRPRSPRRPGSIRPSSPDSGAACRFPQAAARGCTCAHRRPVSGAEA